MSLAYIITAIWVVAVVIALPFTFHMLRRAATNTSGDPAVVWDRHGDVWDLQPNGTYNLRATNSDGFLQGWHLEDIEREFGPATTTAPDIHGGMS